MKLSKNGRAILKPEITNMSEHGFWVFIKDKEYFLPFTKYPWFKDAKISSISNVKLYHNNHLYWPDLDVDLSTEILKNPDKYPLTYILLNVINTNISQKKEYILNDFELRVGT